MAAQHVLGEFPQGDLEGDGWHGEQRGAPQDAAHRPGDLGVGYRLGGGEIDRTGVAVLLQQSRQGSDLIAQRDKRPILPAGADAPASTEFEDRHESLPCTPLGADDEAGAGEGHADPCVDGGLG